MKWKCTFEYRFGTSENVMGDGVLVDLGPMYSRKRGNGKGGHEVVLGR